MKNENGNTLILIAILVLFTISGFAKDIVVYGGSAEYKGQVGGGHYELSNAEYYYKPNGEFMLQLTFEKDKGRGIKQEQDISIIGKLINAKQLNIETTNGTRSYTISGCESNQITIDSYVGNITLNLGICE
ncbi:MAG: hypothetical protein PHE67_00230 [Campylobacterales bacterium]|nr:hypothetical protein [Campylobacterales bacterium]